MDGKRLAMEYARAIMRWALEDDRNTPLTREELEMYKRWEERRFDPDVERLTSRQTRLLLSAWDKIDHASGRA
jgi:hypothetical protein